MSTRRSLRPRKAPIASQISTVGLQLRVLRRQGGWSLGRLAEAAAISKSALSQIEAGRSDPSLQALRRLATALQIPLATLFETPEAAGQRVVHPGERKVLSVSRDRLRYELLTPTLKNRRVEFLRVEFGVDRDDPPELYAHQGEEYGFVVQGRVEVCLDGAQHWLAPGDSVFFPAHIPHYVRNAGRRKAVMIWAITPPRY
jgi:transcriptional regulator with XRE-family HTH domain